MTYYQNYATEYLKHSYNTKYEETGKKPNKYRKPTDQEMSKYNIRPEYNTNKWNPDLEPIFLCGSVFSYESIGNYIYLWALAIKDVQYPKLEMSQRLSSSLHSLESRVLSINNLLHYNIDNDEREIICGFIQSTTRIKNRLQNILDCCSSAISTVKKYENVDDANIASIMLEILFNRYERLYDLVLIINSIDIWLKHFAINVNIIILKYMKH